MATIERAKKISELQELASPAGDDLLVIVDTSGSSTKYVKVSTLMANSDASITVSNAAVLSANTLIVRNDNTPIASTGALGIAKGTIFFDTNYLYVAIADNTLKRVALSTF